MTATVADLGNPAMPKRRRRWPIYLGVVVALGLAALTVDAVTEAQDANNQIEIALTATGNRYAVTAPQIETYAARLADAANVSKFEAKRMIADFIRRGVAPELWVQTGTLAARVDRLRADHG